MEKHKISEAINQHNWVVAINQQTAEYLLAKAEGEKRVAKFQSQKNRVIFSEEIKIKLVTACPGNLSLLRNSTLKKMEICYDVFYRYRTFFGFSLELWLLNNSIYNNKTPTVPQFKFVKTNLATPRSGKELCSANGYANCLMAFKKVLSYNYDTSNGSCGGSNSSNIQSVDNFVETVDCNYKPESMLTACKTNQAYQASKYYTEPYKGDYNLATFVQDAICYN